MDYINTHSYEDRLSNIYINNTLEPNNETSNIEGYLNLLDNNFTFNQKDINILNLIDKQTKPNSNEEKDHKNNELNGKTLPKTDEYKKDNSEKLKKRCGRKRKKILEKQNMVNFLMIILEEKLNILYLNI